MQTQGGAAADTAILSRERNFRMAVYVDWSGDSDVNQPIPELSDYIESISLDRALKGSAPEELLLIEGSSAAELSMTIGGDINGMPLPNVFSRLNPASPLYGYRTVGAEIVYQIIVDTPVGNFVYQQFVGTIRTIKPNRGANTVDITALDKSELLRKPVQIPMWAMSEIAERWGELDSQTCWSHSLLDSALRLCDVGVSAKRPTYFEELDGRVNSNEGVQFWLTGNGTYIPTVGWLDNPNIDCFPNRGKLMYNETGGTLHPDAPVGSTPPQVFAGVGTANYAQAVPAREEDEGFLRYWPLDRNDIGAYGYYYMGLTLNNTAQAAAVSGSYQLFEFYGPWSRVYRIMIGNGKMWVTKQLTRDNGSVVTNTSGTVNIPTNVSTADIFVTFDNTVATGSRVFIKCGANQLGWSAFGANNTEYAFFLSSFNILGRVTVNNIVDLSDAFLCYRENQANPSVAYQPDQCYRRPTNLAVLDRGLNRFSYIPDSKPQEAWKLVTDVAAAEHGSVFFDEQGTFRFWNRETVDEKAQTSVRWVTLDDLESLTWTDNIDSVRNIYTVTANKKRAVYVPSAFSSTDVNEFMTPGSQTKLFRVWVNDIVSPLPWNMQRGFSQDLAGKWKYTNIHHNYIVQFYHPPGWNSGGTVTGEGWYEEGLQPEPVVILGFDGDGWLTVRVDNRSVLPIRFASGVWTDPRANDSAAFNVVGTKIVDYGEQAFVIENQPSIAMYGPKTLDLSGEYIQDTFNATNFVSTLMARTAAPSPTTEQITIPCDPRLQLGDTINLADAQGFGGNIPVQILGINRGWSESNGFTDQLTIELTRAPETPNMTEVPVPKVVRRNGSPNPRLVNNATGWFNGTRVTNAQFVGASTGYYCTNRCITPQAAIIENGKNYTYSVWMYPFFTGGINVELHWYDNGKYYSKGGSRYIPVVANTPLQLSVTAPAPNLAETALLNIIYNGNAVFSKAMFEQASYVNPGQAIATDPLEFFDGSTNPPNTSWNGTAGNSTSTYIP